MRRRLVRSSLLIGNVVALFAVVGFIFFTSHSTSSASVASSYKAGGPVSTSPVDRLTSYDIAANVAQLTSLPEQNAINNQAQSAKVSLAVMSSSDSSVVSKPQIVATALKSRKDILNYTVQNGEDITSLAAKFGVTTDSIRWSNNLSSNTVAAGTKLVIPPVNGIVYTVASGDTIQSLATKYKASADQITAYNDAEIAGITTGEQIIIPGGSAVIATPIARSYGSGSSPAFIGSAQYGSNGYDFGYCTWWVAVRRAQIGNPLPSNLGNASSWPYLGRAYGMAEGSSPRQYAAAVTSTRGEGHVVFVESVNADGSIVISEMNHLGWDVKDTRNISASEASTYMYLY